MKAIKKLLDECLKQGTDNHGFIHYIPKEYLEDAIQEYERLNTPKRPEQKGV